MTDMYCVRYPPCRKKFSLIAGTVDTIRPVDCASNERDTENAPLRFTQPSNIHS